MIIIMKALQFAGWLILFLCLFLAVFVFFQHGPSNFSSGFQQLPGQLMKLAGVEK